MEIPSELFGLLPENYEEIIESLEVSPREFLANSLGESWLDLLNKESNLIENEEILNTLRLGGQALRKIHAESKSFALLPEEIESLEAIVLLQGRPAIIVRNNSFANVPENWASLEEEKTKIEASLPSVGRICLSGHPKYAGTGFLVASDVVMTCRHVVELFAEKRSGEKWIFNTGMSITIDFSAEKDTKSTNEFVIEEIINVYENPWVDMALLKVNPLSKRGANLPDALPIAAQMPDNLENYKVYTVGYPGWDDRNDLQVMKSIFTGIYDVKRLQPGQITGNFALRKIFYHDCSTLGGNSGSCVIGLDDHKVLGLHCGGRYLGRNEAVALGLFVDDPIMKSLGIKFI